MVAPIMATPSGMCSAAAPSDAPIAEDVLSGDHGLGGYERHKRMRVGHNWPAVCQDRR